MFYFLNVFKFNQKNLFRMTNFIATQISQLEKIRRIYFNFDNFNLVSNANQGFQFGLESHFSRSDRKFTNIIYCFLFIKMDLSIWN
jgi:hypothetical protein